MPSSYVVVDRNGVRGLMDAANWPPNETGQVTVHWDNGRDSVVPAKALLAQADGTYAAALSYANTAETTGEGTVVVPVVEESLDIGKRVVETGGGVRIQKLVHEHEEVIDQPLLMQEVDVKRVPIGKIVEGPVAIRHEGDTMIVPVLEERLVIQKQLVLKEEIHITKRQISNRQPQSVTLRSEEARVERLGTAGTPEAALPQPTGTEFLAREADPPPLQTGGSILDRVFPPTEQIRKRGKVRPK